MGNNADLLARLDSALKTITVPDLGDSILAPEQFDRLVRAMQHRTAVINEARFIKMTSHTTHIDRVGFAGRVLRSGGAIDAGTGRQLHRELDPANPADASNPNFVTNQLIARELQAVCGIRDTALRRNLEKDGFENTLVDLFGEAAGRDVEEFAIFADNSITHAIDDVLSLTDGWGRLAGNKIFGQGAGRDFNPGDADWPENLFQAMLMALPKQFLQNRSEWRYYVDFDIEDAYRNLLKARGTQLGDLAQTEDGSFRYKGIPVVYAPMIGRGGAVNVGASIPGRIAMLQHPDNMAWGVFHEVTVEPDRHALGRQTNFVLTIEADVHYEDENAAVTAFIDLEEEQYWG